MKKTSKRDAIIAARELLELGETATLDEIKKAYRAKAKIHHPDTSDSDRKDEDVMQRLTEAYRVLLDYCENYRFPLVPDEDIPLDDNEWWMNRFGNDPLWGKKRE